LNVLSKQSSPPNIGIMLCLPWSKYEGQLSALSTIQCKRLCFWICVQVKISHQLGRQKYWRIPEIRQ